MKGLTDRQQLVYDYIKSYLKEHGFPPTIREIADNFDVSVKGAYDHVKAIERKGFISTSNNRSRAIELHEAVYPNMEEMITVPLVGQVAAGAPILAEQNIEDTLQLPSNVFGSNDMYALRVKGDSMIKAGIYNGDLALIKHASSARNGEIVVALIDDEATIKRFFKEKNNIRLQPENDDYEPIIVRDVTIIGKVVWVIRNLK